VLYLKCTLKKRYMSKKISPKIITSLVVTLTIVGGLLVAPSQTYATSGSASMSFKGLPSILLNCTGATNKITGALSSITGKITSETEKKVPVVNKNDDDNNNCGKAIGRYIGKQMMDKITQDTINWINTGFKGQPLYVKDPASMFKSIADKEVSDFASSIAFDRENFPFGREAALSLINSYRRTFQQNAAYSLNQYVSTGDATDFYTDFHTGGWGAWNAMVLFPQNNPIGFGLMAREQMSTQIEIPNGNNAIANVQRELQEGNGFLSVKKCVESKAGSGYNYVEDTSFDDIGWQQVADSNFADANDPNLSAEQKQAALDLANTNLQHICVKWSTVTPGNAVATQLTDALGTPLKSIGLADDLNKSLSAIFDALINELSQKGLEELTKLTDVQPVTGFGGQGNQNSNGLNSLYQTISNQNTSTWNTFGARINLYDLLIAGEDGDVSTHDTLIDTQEQWITTMMGIQGALTNLIRMEKKLDYWMPGPRPDWIEKAGEKLDEDLSDIQDPTIDSGYYVALISDPSGTALQAIDQNLKEIAAGIQLIFNNYYASVSEMYDPKYLTYYHSWDNWKHDLETLYSITMPEIRKIPGYEDTRDSNNEELQTVTSALNRLRYLKDKVGPLYLDLNNYTTQLQNTPSTDPNYTTIQDNINITNAEIEKNVKIFKQLAPGLKNQEAIDALAPLGTLYNDSASFVEDLTYTAKKESLAWPIARRPYNDPDIWPQDTESRCWNPIKNQMLSGYPSVSAVVADIENYYTQKYAPNPVPVSLHVSSASIIGLQNYILNNSQYAIAHEQGNGQCSLLPQGGVAYGTSFSRIPNFAPLGDRQIDLPNGSGGQLQDTGYSVWDHFSISLSTSAPNHQGYSVFEDRSDVY
jgi:hypothetical protein